MPMHKYRVVRDCLFGDQYHRAGEEVTINTDEGLPPYHLEPLDGGPVMEQKKHLYGAPKKGGAAKEDSKPEAKTFSQIQQAQPSKPLGLPSDRKKPKADEL